MLFCCASFALLKKIYIFCEKIVIFAEGVTLSTNKLEATDDNYAMAISKIAEKDYDKKKVAVFDISLVKDNAKVQPSGKVKITMPAPFTTENGYTTYHIKGETVEELETFLADGKINIAENGSADFNAVVKVSLTPFKEDMNGFPFSLFKKYVPDELYISSTVRVNKTDDEMGYNVTNVGLKINNLSAEDTDDLFHTLDAVLKIGSAENLNMQIGTTAVNALIGNAENIVFAYSMQALGKTAFGFAEISGFKCLMVY